MGYGYRHMGSLILSANHTANGAGQYIGSELARRVDEPLGGPIPGTGLPRRYGEMGPGILAQPE